MKLKVITLLPKAWEISPTDLQRAEPSKMLGQLRSSLVRAGASESNGFLIGFMHGEYESGRSVIPLHLHGLAGGGLIDVVGRLRQLGGFKKRDRVTRPVMRSMLNDPPRQISYLLKSYWPARRIGPVGDDRDIKRERVTRRIPEPFHTEYLLWLDRYEVGDLALLMGCKWTTDGLVLT